MDLWNRLVKQAIWHFRLVNFLIHNSAYHSKPDFSMMRRKGQNTCPNYRSSCGTSGCLCSCCCSDEHQQITLLYLIGTPPSSLELYRDTGVIWKKTPFVARRVLVVEYMWKLILIGISESGKSCSEFKSTSCHMSGSCWEDDFRKCHWY